MGRWLLISACLLGNRCKYDGGSNALPEEQIAALRRRYRLLPVCPEVAGGLPVPREASERRDGGVYDRSGADVSAAFEAGARKACLLARRWRCQEALLKERSPSCGLGAVYDGSFSGTLISGDGVTAEMLRQLGLTVYGESEWEKLL